MPGTSNSGPVGSYTTAEQIRKALAAGSPDSLWRGAITILNARAELERKLADVKWLVNDTRSDWKGKAAEAFEKIATQTVKGAEAFVDALITPHEWNVEIDNAGNYLRNIQNEYNYLVTKHTVNGVFNEPAFVADGTRILQSLSFHYEMVLGKLAPQPTTTSFGKPTGATDPNVQKALDALDPKKNGTVPPGAVDPDAAADTTADAGGGLGAGAGADGGAGAGGGAGGGAPPPPALDAPGGGAGGGGAGGGGAGGGGAGGGGAGGIDPSTGVDGNLPGGGPGSIPGGGTGGGAGGGPGGTTPPRLPDITPPKGTVPPPFIGSSITPPPSWRSNDIKTTPSGTAPPSKLGGAGLKGLGAGGAGGHGIGAGGHGIGGGGGGPGRGAVAPGLVAPGDAGGVVPSKPGHTAGGLGQQGAGGGMYPPGSGGAGAATGQQNNERERHTWLTEDEEVWGAGTGTSAAMLGRTAENDDEHELY